MHVLTSRCCEIPLHIHICRHVRYLREQVKLEKCVNLVMNGFLEESLVIPEHCLCYQEYCSLRWCCVMFIWMWCGWLILSRIRLRILFLGTVLFIKLKKNYWSLNFPKREKTHVPKLLQEFFLHLSIMYFSQMLV